MHDSDNFVLLLSTITSFCIIVNYRYRQISTRVLSLSRKLLSIIIDNHGNYKDSLIKHIMLSVKITIINNRNYLKYTPFAIFVEIIDYCLGSSYQTLQSCLSSTITNLWMALDIFPAFHFRANILG